MAPQGGIPEATDRFGKVLLCPGSARERIAEVEHGVHVPRLGAFGQPIERQLVVMGKDRAAEGVHPEPVHGMAVAFGGEVEQHVLKDRVPAPKRQTSSVAWSPGANA
jgi:hypothetical protein